MGNPLSRSIILLASVMTSCSEPKSVEEESTSSFSELEHENTPIVIKRPEGDRADQSEYQEIVVRLDNPMREKSMADSVYLTDEGTGKRYKVPFFREILGVRSSNEQKYVMKLYSDNSLYGIDPLYKDVPQSSDIQQ
jgi:hypothetical protein